MKNASGMIAVAAVALAIGVAAALAGCQDSLEIKEYVRQQVDVANTHLVLTELATSTGIPESGTASWPVTIFTETSSRTFQLTNSGPDVVTLVGASPVAITGGGGQAAYGGIVQPAQTVLQPGDSTTFSVSFTPPAPDTDYACDFVINSDDSTNPAFKFYGLGHSTQWHGSKAIASVTSEVLYSYPKIAIVGSTIYVVYQKYNTSTASDRGIVLRYSTDGGSSWSSEDIVVSAETNTISGFSFAASSSTLNLFYYDSTAGALYYAASYVPPGTVSFASTGTFAYATSYYTANNNVIAQANGNVYVAAYDNTNKKLTLAVRGDSVPYMGIPSFSYYPITDNSANTGGFNVSIEVDSSNVYLLYADGFNIRLAVVPLSTISDGSTYSYSLVAGSDSINQHLTSLIVDAGKAYALWGRASDFAIRSAVSTDLTLSSWSTPVPIEGENITLSPMLGFMRVDSAQYALYEKYDYLGYSLRLSTSADDGATWSSDFVDGPNSGLQGSGCSMARSGSDFYIVYSTGAGHENGYSITLKKSLDGGANW